MSNVIITFYYFVELYLLLINIGKYNWFFLIYCVLSQSSVFFEKRKEQCAPGFILAEIELDQQLSHADN